eukprot:GHVQ01005759.1.p1 GENE.GHVQ01005759.1~~GHVQ01005759.1.p1  ORF type:complete len:817 (+),score=123.56 GHVQ01005759.1:491-2941(+)
MSPSASPQTRLPIYDFNSWLKDPSAGALTTGTPIPTIAQNIVPMGDEEMEHCREDRGGRGRARKCTAVVSSILRVLTGFWSLFVSVGLCLVGLLQFVLLMLFRKAGNRGTKSASARPKYEFDAWLRDPSVIAVQEQNNNMRGEEEGGGLLGQQLQKDPRPGVVIVYGTEYGCSEEIAHRLAAEIRTGVCERHVGLKGSVKVVVRPMEEFCTKIGVRGRREGKSKETLGLTVEHNKVCFLICSTQGDGVPPVKARDFHAHMKYLSSAPITADPTITALHLHLRDKPFAVLALGDRGYPQFCKCGKDFDRFFTNLGMQAILPRCDVDQEDPATISTWISNCVSLLQSDTYRHLFDYDCAETTCDGGGPSEEDEDSSENSTSDLGRTFDESLAGVDRMVPRSIPVLHKSNLCTYPIELKSAADTSCRYLQSLNGERRQETGGGAGGEQGREGQGGRGDREMTVEGNEEAMKNKIDGDLRLYTQSKQVFHIEFDISDLLPNGRGEGPVGGGPGGVACDGVRCLYEPGDALGLWTRNCPEKVEDILKWCNVTGDEKMDVTSKIRKWIPPTVLQHAQRLETAMAPQIGRDSDWVKAVGCGVVVRALSLRSLLTYALDIRNLKADLERRCTEERNKRGGQGRGPGGSVAEDKRAVHLMDVCMSKEAWSLSEVKELIDCLKPLQPRLYSISSSPLVTPTRVSITAALVHYTHTDGSYMQGVATGELNLRTAVGSRILAYLQPNPEFRLPDDISTPLVMVGPGTGFAPFRAFILQRNARMREQNMEPVKENCLLFYGCRNSPIFETTVSVGTDVRWMLAQARFHL